VWAYPLLVFGAIIFSLPFVWLISTSIKSDQEMFSEKLKLFPGKPTASLQSPYLDRDFYREGVSQTTRSFLPLLEKWVEQMEFTFPPDVNPAEARSVVAQGLAKKLEARLPAEFWQEESPLEIRLQPHLTPELIREVFDGAFRWFALSSVTLRSEQLELIQVGADSLSVVQWQPHQVQLAARSDQGLPCAVTKTDFREKNFWRLDQVITTPFPAENLQRLQIVLHPDDTWHRLYCFIERDGVRYQSEHPFYPKNYNWQTVYWQIPAPNAPANTIRSWISLHEVTRGPEFDHGPHAVKVILEMHRSTPWQAWWGKISLNYLMTLKYFPFWRYTLTSFSLAILNIVLAVFSCSMVAFAVARLSWPGRDFWFVIMLATMMIPGHVTLIPNFLIWKSLKLFNTLIPLWLGSAFAAPFYVFLLRQFLKSIPIDIDDAARIDGCGHFRIYWHILLPLIKPPLTIVVVGTFLGSWNNFMGPLIFIADQRLYPLVFGLYAFAQQIGNNPGLVMAGSFLLTLPIIFIFLFAQRYFIEGMTLTGLKR
jgi:ABC-type glycerol-3-phosphate transport system permease component